MPEAKQKRKAKVKSEKIIELSGGCGWRMGRFVLQSLGLFLCFGVMFAAGLSYAKPLVLTPDGSTLFVVNADSGSVSAINTLTDEKSAEVYVGKDPHNLVLSPDGTRLYVVCQGSATLVTLDTETLSVVANLRVSAQPYDAVTDLSGDFLYVSSTRVLPM